MRNAFFSCAATLGATGTAIGTMALGSVIGGEILKSAGWTIAGQPIIEATTLAGYAASGTAVILGPLFCCIITVSNSSSGSNDQGRAGLTSTGSIIMSGAYGAVGAGMAGATKVQVGYAAAATAAGTIPAVLGVLTTAALIGGVGYCTYALCCKPSQERSRNEPFVVVVPNNASVEEISNIVANSGSNQRLPILNARGQQFTFLDTQANTVQPRSLSMQ